MSYHFDGRPVSQPWHTVLTHARRMGVEFRVNDGRRTMSMQLARVRKHGVWSVKNPTGAAWPSPAAPHINYGLCNHAVDADGAAELVAFLRRKGAKSASRPIPTEAWHIQVSRADLLKLAKHIEKERRR